MYLIFTPGYLKALPYLVLAATLSFTATKSTAQGLPLAASSFHQPTLLVSSAIKKEPTDSLAHIKTDTLSFAQVNVEQKVASENGAISTQMLLRLARYYSKQKKYAVALKLYFKAFLNSHKPGIGTTVYTGKLDKALQSADEIWPNLNSLEFLDSSKTTPISTKTVKSKAVTANLILKTFKDHKIAESYGLFLHVQQPLRGKRRSFKWFDGVGHSFITLIKYNTDGSNAAITYGFYPKKYFIFQATPIFPTAPSVYKNDRDHLWDESMATFISAREFRQILRLTKRYARRPYHLNRNNCTDFLLKIASIAGIYIEQTKGYWPLGRGNDPGDTGQSILEDKYQLPQNSLIFVDKPSVQDLPVILRHGANSSGTFHR